MPTLFKYPCFIETRYLDTHDNASLARRRSVTPFQDWKIDSKELIFLQEYTLETLVQHFSDFCKRLKENSTKFLVEIAHDSPG